MRQSPLDGVKFILLTLLPVILIGAGMIWSNQNMLAGIAESVDSQEHSRAWQAVKSAFQAEENHLAGVATDNAHWGDAVLNTYRPVNESWIEQMWGLSTADINYDVVWVVEPDGTTLTAYQNGNKTQIDPETYLGHTFDQLLAAAPKDNSTFSAITSLVTTPDGLMTVAAAPIVPNGEPGINVPAPRANILLMGKHVTAADIARMGSQYSVDDIQLNQPGKAGAKGGTLTDRWLHPVAGVSWKDRHPGDAASAMYRSTAFALVLGLFLVISPITIVHLRTMQQLSEQRRQAYFDAYHDHLTGLANRALFLKELEDEIGKPTGGQVVILYVDLDGFKSVNDTYGHNVGDRLLCIVASRLQDHCADVPLARLSGDEFAALYVGPDAVARSEAAASAIIDLVKEPFDVDGRHAYVGASVGLAVAEPGTTSVELMRRADIAMYTAKSEGRGQWRWFCAANDVKRLEDQTLAVEIAANINSNSFEVVYQPVVEAGSRQISGVEALARWPSHSEHKFPPDQFIQVAERNGLIDQLGAQILRKACRDALNWGDLTLAVNVSPAQLNNRSFVSEIVRIAEEEHFPLCRLEIELTETVLIRNQHLVQEVIGHLHDLGVKVVLDDFGTGFASVGYLQNFAFDKIKLDRSLTKNVLRDSAVQKIVQGTILIAKGLSARIVAEGVETEEEAQIMRLAGFHQLQGYYFGRPQPAEAFQEFRPARTGSL